MKLLKNSLEFLYFIHFQEKHTFTEYQNRMGISYLYKFILCQKILEILLGTTRAISVGRGEVGGRGRGLDSCGRGC